MAISLIKSNSKIIEAIELKALEASTDNVDQMQRYVTWLEQYYIPNRVSDTSPVLITKKIPDKQQSYYKDIVKSFKEFNRKNSSCIPLKYIEYELINHNLVFSEVKY